jgi:uncharacterized protein
MDCRIFVNLPVRNVVASSAFYAALGAEWDERFCDASSVMMRLTDHIAVVLLHQDRFAASTLRRVADARTHSQMLLRLSCENRADVDRLVAIAGWAGGRANPRPAEDGDALYRRSFEDPDGHIWEAVWMDAAAAALSPALVQAA